MRTRFANLNEFGLALFVVLPILALIVGGIVTFQHFQVTAKEKCEAVHPEAKMIYAYGMRHDYYHCTWWFTDDSSIANDFDSDGEVLK